MRTPGGRLPEARHFAVAMGLLLATASCSELVSDGFDYGNMNVRVARRSGEPVPGVRLVLYTGTQVMSYGESDETGRFSFEFVPPGEYGVRAVPEEPFVTSTGQASTWQDGIRMEEGGRTEVSFTLLKHGPGTIRVQVRDASGAPVPGTDVALYAHYGDVAGGVTGLAGEHEFAEIPFGGYGVRVETGLGYVTPPGRGSSFVDGLVVDAGSVETLEFTVQRCTGSIRVRAIDRVGHGVAGVRLSLYTFRGPIAEAVTDASGAAEFPQAPCGNLGVALQPGEGYTFPSGPGASFVDGIRVTDGISRELSFAITPCRGAVQVRVADRSGAPVQGTGLVLYSLLGVFAEGATEAGGVFTFAGVPCGEFGVRLLPPPGYSVPEGRGSSYVDALAVENGTNVSVAFVLPRS